MWETEVILSSSEPTGAEWEQEEYAPAQPKLKKKTTSPLAQPKSKKAATSSVAPLAQPKPVVVTDVPDSWEDAF